MKSFAKYSVLGALSLGLAGLAVAGPVAASGQHGDHGERAGARFEKLDADADGFVTAKEMEALRLARFTAKDANNDGFLTLEELQARSAKRFDGRGDQPDDAEMTDRSRRMLRYLDEDGDGKVAFGEMPSRDGGMISRFDTDADGRVSRAEFDDAAAKFRMRRGAGHGHERGQEHGHGHDGGHRGGHMGERIE